jgi:hypothetical protein
VSGKTAGKQPTQAVPDQGEQRAPERLVPKDPRGAGSGGPFEPRDADKDLHGGQTGAAYHGHGQLGEDEVEGQANANAPSKDA